MTFTDVGSEGMKTRKARRTGLFARELLIFLRRQFRKSCLESPWPLLSEIIRANVDVTLRAATW